MIWLIVVGGCLAAGVALYWLVVIGEGTYLGRFAVRAIYQAGARVYDRVRQSVTAGDETHLRAPLRIALLSSPLAPSLDVATGTGRAALMLAAEPWYEGAIIGLDLAPAMLAEAARKAEAAGLAGRVDWHIGSGDNLRRWPDGTFGLVTCLEAVEYFPRPRRAVREMWRALLPGGTLIISTWTPRHARWLPGKALTAAQVRELLRPLGCAECEIRPWQPGQYDLVIAVKPAAAL
ncbi:MAG TPA: class I SAM-dependent methyltransferase [Herpetosiphonaceae bacterium]